MAFVLQGLRRAAVVWSAQGGSRLMSSSSSLNRLPAQTITPPTVSPNALQVLLQRVFPLRRRPTTAITSLPTPAKPTYRVGSTVEEGVLEGSSFDCLNRNARRGKKANHGKRPVSSARRKQKNRTFGRKNG